MQIKKAYQYYVNYISDENKRNLFEKYNFSSSGVVSSNDWELFAAILLDEQKKKQGSDLEGHEIKSAKTGNSFEYQYHKKTGLKKLSEDERVKHIFISYENKYKDIVVREMCGKTLTQKISSWREGFLVNYEGEKQRFRKSLGYNFVRDNSKIILRIVNGKLI
jgi:hypothetical protein